MIHTGKGGITANIIADSLSQRTQARVTSIELVFPWFIHDELTQLPDVSWSVQAPSLHDPQGAIEAVVQQPAMPIHWGRAGHGPQSGLEAKNDLAICEYNGGQWLDYLTREEAWFNARDAALLIARGYATEGYHADIVTRVLAPYRRVRSVATATDWLTRIDAVTRGELAPVQPETRELLDTVHAALTASQPVTLNAFDWHLPYYPGGVYRESRTLIPETRDEHRVTLTDALRWSAIGCAQVAQLGERVTPALLEARYAKLRAYPACLAHQALCMESPRMDSDQGDTINDPRYPHTWQVGVTHADANRALWSGNLRGFIQRRQLLRQQGAQA